MKIFFASLVAVGVLASGPIISGPIISGPFSSGPFTLGPAPAWANGGNTHFWISLEARELLPEGSLKELLMAPENKGILMNGSVFPDGGYVVDDDYGETAHWEPFVSGYIRWIRRRFAPPFHRGEAARHAVFLLGIASHNMADMVFDSLFMKIAEVEDASGWSDSLLESFDTATDVFLVAATGLDLPLDPWVPAEELAEVFTEELGYAVDPAVIESGQSFLPLVVQYGRDKGLGDPARVEELRARYPWGSAHLLDPLAPGSPPREAVAVAAYWQAIWDRLHGHENPENQIIATHPSAGSLGHPTDHRQVASQLAVVFGHELTRESLAITVSGEGGQELPVSLRTWGNLVRLVPQQDWPAGETLTVTVEGGGVTIDGVVYPEPWWFSFSTAAGDPSPCCEDPTPNTSEPVASALGRCGCKIAEGLPPLPWLFLLLLVLFSKRRRIPRSP